MAEANTTPGYGQQIKSMEAPSLVKWMRALNVCTALLIITAGVVAFATGTINVQTVICGIYVICFGLLFLCFETQVASVEKLLVENFGFMFKWQGRLLYFLFMAMLCFVFTGKIAAVIGYIAGGIAILVVFFNIYVIRANPAYYSKMLEENQKLIAKGMNAKTTVTEDYNKAVSVGKIAVTVAQDPVARQVATAAYNSGALNGAMGGGLDSDPNWEKAKDEHSGNFYYYNKATNETRWVE